MRAALAWAILATGCAHAGAARSRVAQAAVPLPASAADAAFEVAMLDLGAARIQAAGRGFKDFADRNPDDPRVPTARFHQAYAALNQLDQVRGLDQAQEILAQLGSAGGESVALRQLQALILARAQALQEQAAYSELLNRCQGQAGTAVDKERAQSRAQVGKLQQELQRREETLEQVKQRLLEIQRMASETLGGPPPDQGATGQ